MIDVTVITPSLPSREHMLKEAVDSVACQTLKANDHLIGVDWLNAGPAAVRNTLLEATTTEWVGFLDDDDILDRHHLDTLASAADRADVIGSYCRFSGDSIPAQFCNRPYDRKALRRHGIFPITVLARRQAVLAAGGFGQERYEDWALWNRMADQGCRFEIIPIVTWTYRLGHGNRTTGNAA